jgi:hypothetical protein
MNSAIFENLISKRPTFDIYSLPKSFFLLTPHPTLSHKGAHKGRGELEEKTFGKRYTYHNLAIFSVKR